MPNPSPRSNPPQRPARPLIITADPALLDDLLRLTAAAGTEADVVGDPGAARSQWSSAPLVLLGQDCAQDAAHRGLPRRGELILVGRDLDDAAIWAPGIRLGAEEVVFLPDAEGWLTERITAAAEGPGAGGSTVCVVGGRGGAGASTLAAALALTATRRGLRTMLIDADPLGGGVDLVLGQEDAAGIRWPELAAVSGRVDAGALRDSLPRLGELRVLTYERSALQRVPADSMAAALGAGRRGSDLVVVDLPRMPDAAAELALAAGGPVLLIVPAEVRAVAAAARVAGVLATHASDLRVVVRGPAPAGLSADLVAASLGLPLVGHLRAEPGLAQAQERGEPPTLRRNSPLAGFCGRFLDTLALGVAA